MIVLLGGGGYFAWQANVPPTVATAALGLSTEQLEQALAERRKAEALAAEKRQLEDAARRKASIEAEAKRLAEAELEQARQARVKVEEELASLKADIEARRQAESGQREQADATLRRADEEAAKSKAEAEVVALRQAEEDARKKAIADAEAKRQADEALARAEADRQRAEQEARQKAEAETAALKQASEETQRTAVAEAKRQAEREKAEADKAAAVAAKQKEEAEAAEKALRLESADRQRLQVALTSLGFDTRGSDGLFGPRTRETIAAWQKARHQPPTGFLTGAQQQALLTEAAPAVSRYDEQRKAEEEAKARPVPAAPVSAVGSPSPGSPDGLWRGTYECGHDVNFMPFTFDLEVRLTNGSGTWYSPRTSVSNNQTISIRVSVDGPSVTVVRGSIGGAGSGNLPLSGRFEGNSIRASNYACRMTLTRGGSPVATALAPSAPSPAQPSASPDFTGRDGMYSGNYSFGHTRAKLTLQVGNGRGSGTIAVPGCDPSQYSVTFSPAGMVSGDGHLNCALQGLVAVSPGPYKIDGKHEGGMIRLRFVGSSRGSFDVTLRPGDLAAAPSVSSPDGLWRGTYTCGPGPSSNQGFSFELELRLMNGSGTWKTDNVSAKQGSTYEIGVAVGPGGVVVTRLAPGSRNTSVITRQALPGRYDGNVIRAAGRESESGRECTLDLTRA